jgi:hypothetical protein
MEKSIFHILYVLFTFCLGAFLDLGIWFFLVAAVRLPDLHRVWPSLLVLDSHRDSLSLVFVRAWWSVRISAPPVLDPVASFLIWIWEQCLRPWLSSWIFASPISLVRFPHLVFHFRPCEQAHRRRYFGLIFWYFIFANSRTDGGISDRSFGISFLRTVAPTEVFRIDLLVFCFCEQSHQRRYFGSIFWYFVFANSRTDGGISDRSFGISFLWTCVPTELFQAS